MRLGILADTHGTLLPGVLEVFAKVDRILHAGDVGDPAILAALEALAPVTAVFGNVDGSVLRGRLPRVAEVTVDGFRFVVTHGDQFVSPRPDRLKETYPAADVIVFGHTHKPLIHAFEDYSMVLNPGSAGAHRSDRLPSVAIMETEPGIPPRARIVPLTAGSPPAASS
ncbi:MAG: metallophosphoesterase family protein [Gemmatimonadota bacterium]